MLSFAAQVLGEDLVLVTGQQDRMLRGGNTWANPVPYDKMAVRYRRWRNGLAQRQRDGGSAPAAPSSLRMSAGELFALDSEDECAVQDSV